MSSSEKYKKIQIQRNPIIYKGDFFRSLLNVKIIVTKKLIEKYAGRILMKKFVGRRLLNSVSFCKTCISPY